MAIHSYVRVSWWFVVWITLFGRGACDNGNSSAATRGEAGTGATNSECVILGVDADGFLERIDPKKFLFVDTEQRSYVERACENYKKMRSQPGCVPQQQNSIYDYACDTVLDLAQATANAPCWNRTGSCALVKLLPPTDSITAAYCKFLTATGLQLGCALELTPACESPSNAAIAQAAAKGRSFLDTFQCTVLSPVGGPRIPSNVTGAPSVEVVSALGSSPAPSFNLFPQQGAAQPEPPKNRQSTEAPLVLKTKLPACDFGQNAKSLLCLSNLLGVQERFSATNNSLIFQELAKDNSTELADICKQFNTYHDCMINQVFLSESRRCLTKSRAHDFSLLFYAFCDPANQPRVQRIRPCVQKLMKNTDPVQSAAFQKCRDKLATMRSQVRVVMKESQNALALCRGMLAAEGFFDCVPPVVTAVCDNESVSNLAFFRQWVADNIDTVGCPLDEPRLTNFAAEAGSAATQVTPTTPAEVAVKSATIAIVESENKASTVKVDETAPILHVDSLGNACTQEDIRRFTICYANISGIDLNPMTIIKKPEQLEAVCEGLERFRECRDALDCMPPGGDGLNNMFGFFCNDDAEDYKKHKTCMQQAAQTPAAELCANRVLPKNLLNMDADQACAWTKEVINCSYNELLTKCSIETADYAFKIWQGFGKGINVSCDVEPPLTSNETVIGVPVSCTAAEGDEVERCIQPFTVITDRLASIIEGGLQAFLKAMRRITEIFTAGCDIRVGFDDCMRKAVTKGSQCHVSSCLVKVAEYACNFTGDSDMSLEDRLKCMWSLIGEPDFGKCLKLFPKNAFENINRLRLYLPRFVGCLEAPLLRKCGQTTLNLVKALSSQASANPNDQTCVVHVPGLNDLNGTTSLGSGRNASVKPVLETTKTAGGAARAGTLATTKPAASTPAPVTDTRPLCRKPEEAARLEKCHMLLNNRSLEPLPLKIFNSVVELDAACNIYKSFANCTQSLRCRFEYTAAIQETLLRVCTVRYDDYKVVANCLNSFAMGPKGSDCADPLFRLNLTAPQTDGGQSACQSIGAMIACINPDLGDQCGGRAVDVVYDLHSAFAKQFKPDCSIKPPVVLVPGTECVRVEVDAFEKCTKKLNNYSINPISIIGDPDQWSAFCAVVKSDFQPCLRNLTCSPKPFATAYNDTLVYACTSDDIRARYDKYKACLATVLNTAVGRQCVEPYKGIQWYGGDDPKGNPARACKSVSSALSCAAPEVSQRCEQDAVKFMYDVNQRLMTTIQSDCRLAIPSDLPTKLNLTTTTESPEPGKTTPPKAKEATTQPGGASSSVYEKTVLGSIMLSWALLRFLN